MGLDDERHPGSSQGDIHPNQSKLFDQIDDDEVSARATDPVTSHLAAVPRRGTRARKLLAAFDGLPNPACWDEAADIAGIPAQSSPWRAVTTLHKAGFIEVAGIGRSKLGAKAQAYVITKAGWEALHGA